MTKTEEDRARLRALLERRAQLAELEAAIDELVGAVKATAHDR